MENKTKYRATKISNNSDWYVLEYFCTANKRWWKKGEWKFVPIIRDSIYTHDDYPYGIIYAWKLKGVRSKMETFVKAYPNIQDYLQWYKERQSIADKHMEKQLMEKTQQKLQNEKDYPPEINL